MRVTKILVFFFIFFCLLAQIGTARVGVAIAPATGSHNFSLDGGTIEYTVYNTGDTDAVFMLTASGTAANFTLIEPTQTEIKANSYATFKAIINPTEDVKGDETYTLIVTANMALLGVIAIGAESKANLHFYGVRTKPYIEERAKPSVEIPYTGEITKLHEKIPHSLIYIVGIVVVFSVVCVIYRRYRKVVNMRRIKENKDKFLKFTVLTVSIVLSFLFLPSFVSATISVDAPVIPATVNPGDSFTVKANVTETTGYEYINETNITCVGTGGVEYTDSWDSYTRLNNSITWVNISLTTIEINSSITLNTSSINGTWNCTVYALNSTGSTASNMSQLSVNTRVGIIVSQSSCTFDIGAPGDTNKNWTCPAGGNTYNRYTHDGNININVTINGTDLSGVTDSSWTVGVGNVTYKNVTSGAVAPSPPGIALTSTAVDLVTSWSRGTYPNKSANDLYCWLDYPRPLKVQTYEGTVTLTVKQA